ncbi:tRNA (adenosine(37)-N6)-dimethylallyltransferase MiaA [Paenibacillus ginsengarvi]|uniref:tRNA dimethylallyltransferase n=1 Tax=Paenibacillus ginsengarvi TaxID=400777 RepID=A0A3B0CU62_9BACL|nr:tRNA (adenosine(37)-N6)-dimethylallyltransferase MiaA [Paenibacillus ginsengarvi]RKN86587.1 tRNA (adenosine(37)-N6)-dimethylallyltransferase MiaA [Paenibacillus ginsengarvi]
MTETKPRLLVLVGPTAVGKTQLSLEAAARYGCEIISGDSMQVYRGMDIGTAKASLQERSIVPHHMIDIHDPDHPFSVAEFQERVRGLIADIGDRGKLPFIVGGTGLYIESVCYDYQFSDIGVDEEYRAELNSYADRYGEEALHDKLKAADPETAARIHPNDRRRTIRALEIVHIAGAPVSREQARHKKESPYELCIVGLTMDREILYKRIEARIDEMVGQGLVGEVERLLTRGYTTDLPSMLGLGYKEIAGYVKGDYDLDFAVELLKRNTRRFAKRQLSWFRHMTDIRWIDVTEPNFSEHLQTFHDILAGKFTPDPE